MLGDWRLLYRTGLPLDELVLNKSLGELFSEALVDTPVRQSTPEAELKRL